MGKIHERTIEKSRLTEVVSSEKIEFYELASTAF